MMRSATAFFPPSMITFMNLDSSTDPNFGSGSTSRLGTSRRRGMGPSSFQIFSWRPPGSSLLEGPQPRVLHLLGGLDRAGRDLPRGGRHAGLARRRLPRVQAFFGRLAPYFERDCLRSLTP